MCLLELFRLHITHTKTIRKNRYPRFNNTPRISNLYPEFLLLKVDEDSTETEATSLEDSRDFSDYEQIHLYMHKNEQR